jgi:enamine deaminase RidA (YjgF/YER057c/UK114 family)
VFANLGNILEGIGTSLDCVSEETAFLVGEPSSVYPIFAKVRDEVFRDRLPASTAVFVEALAAPTFRCEVKLVAAMPDPG